VLQLSVTAGHRAGGLKQKLLTAKVAKKGREARKEKRLTARARTGEEKNNAADEKARTWQQCLRELCEPLRTLRLKAFSLKARSSQLTS
jgi:hypothetical protein